ncbi:MAG TPA: hypothetical protein VNT54_09845, partial [Solirubrobacteraceae bacterium]|nr:hypothetical protein [Solirubrobacteraceae bacterium]
MSSDRAPRRLAALLVLGAGLVGASGALPATAQDARSAGDSTVTTPPEPPPVPPAAAAPPAPPAPAAVPSTGPVAPLDFLSDRIEDLDLPPEPARAAPPQRKRETTIGPRRAARAEAPSAPDAAQDAGGEGRRGELLGPAALPAQIPNFFIGSFRIPPF